MQIKLAKRGNISAVRLPAAVLKETQVAPGNHLELETQDGKIILEPVRTPSRLHDMLAAITQDNRHASVDFGPPVGRELG